MMIVLSSQRHQLLAEAISQVLKLDYQLVDKAEFANQEIKLRVELKSASSQAVVVQDLSQQPAEALVELGLIIDALRRQSVKQIILVAPYLAYSKQDKVFNPGEPLSAKVMACLLQATGFDDLISVDLHNQAIVGFFDQPMVQLSALPLFVDYLSQFKTAKALVVAPDAGGIKTADKLAQALDLETAYIDKQRQDHLSGQVKIRAISRSVKDKTVLMIDDMISTGQTLIQAAEFLTQKGAAKIIMAASHHLWIKGVQAQLEASPIDQLIVTDTVQSPVNQAKYPKLKIISMAETIAAKIKTL